MARIAANVTELIGHTPLVRLNRLSAGLPATVVVKLESRNPAASVGSSSAQFTAIDLSAMIRSACAREGMNAMRYMSGCSSPNSTIAATPVSIPMRSVLP